MEQGIEAAAESRKSLGRVLGTEQSSFCWDTKSGTKNVERGGKRLCHLEDEAIPKRPRTEMSSSWKNSPNLHTHQLSSEPTSHDSWVPLWHAGAAVCFLTVGYLPTDFFFKS